MVTSFEKYVAEANAFIKNLALQMGDPDNTGLAIRVTKSVFKTLRRRITPEQSMHLISQLPLILKGLYVDGWELSEKLSDSQTWDDFLAELRNAALPSSGTDFAGDEHARKMVAAFFNTLKQYVSDGELNHLKSQLPPMIAEVIA